MYNKRNWAYAGVASDDTGDSVTDPPHAASAIRLQLPPTPVGNGTPIHAALALAGRWKQAPASASRSRNQTLHSPTTAARTAPDPGRPTAVYDRSSTRTSRTHSPPHSAKVGLRLCSLPNAALSHTHTHTHARTHTHAHMRNQPHSLSH